MSRLTQADLDKGCTLAQRTPSTVQHVEESPEAPVNGYGEAGEVLETERKAVPHVGRSTPKRSMCRTCSSTATAFSSSQSSTLGV